MLDRLRGAGPAKRHNARTIAALTGNPGCTRRAVLDAAGVDKTPAGRSASAFPANFGQSRFALARGNALRGDAQGDGGALLLRDARRRAPRRRLQRSGRGRATTRSARRHARTRDAARRRRPRAALIDHPLLTLDVAGQTVFLEPDLIAFQVEGRLQVVEIKSFAIVDGQADSAKVSAAAMQAAVYVLALRRLLADWVTTSSWSATRSCWSARRTSRCARPRSCSTCASSSPRCAAS